MTMNTRVQEVGMQVGLRAPRRYTVSWERVEERLDLRLPKDYKEFVYFFGPGEFDGFLIVAVPGLANPNIELVSWARRTQENHRYLIEEERVVEEGLAEWPYPLTPSPGFFMPWGMTANGDRLHWDTNGEPDEWTVVVEDNGSFELFTYSVSMSEFLARFLRDDLDVPCLPASEGGPPVAFEAWDGGSSGEGGLIPYGFFADPPE